MISRIALALLVILLACGSVFTQKTRRKTLITSVSGQARPANKKLSRYQVNIRIAEGPKLFVSIVSPVPAYEDDRPDIDALDLKALLSDLSGASRNTAKSSGVSRVVIDASPAVTMNDLWTTIGSMPRDRSAIGLSIPASSIPSGRMPGGMSVNVPWIDANLPNLEVRPNPLVLTVTIDESDALSLNNEPTGTLSDPQPLIQTLLRIFRAREENGVFREGSNEIEKEVSIVMPASRRKFAQLIAIVEAVKIPGGGPINLITEPPNAVMIEGRKDLIISAPIKPPR